MKVLLSGASGLVGSALLPRLREDGHEPVRLVRRRASEGELSWDPEKGVLDGAALVGCDAAVHLAGENIASGRWTAARKERIETSRTRGTRLLAETLASLPRPPAVLVSASAIGFYGDRGDELVDEGSPPGEGFLAGVCRRWEAATAAAREAEIRVVSLRIGVVLDPRGGALGRMLPAFRLGLGGPVGDGRQWMSWITLADLVGSILHLLKSPYDGPVNVVAPAPVRQRELAAALGRTLRRPTIFPLPAWAARFALGEMADELLLASTRVDGQLLQKLGYAHRHAELHAALRHLLSR